MTHQSRISTSQLAFLLFAYVFSGLALYNVKNVLTVILCVMCTAGAAALGVLISDGGGISDALSSLFPLGNITASSVLAASCIFPLVLDCFSFADYSERVYESSRNPAIFFVAALAAAVIFSGKITYTARMAEVMSLLSAVLLIFSFFGKPSLFLTLEKSIDGIEALGTFAVPMVLACEVGGDGRSFAMMAREGRPAPIEKAARAALGALCGGLLYTAVSMFFFPHGNISEVLFVWASAAIRLSVTAFSVRELCRFRLGYVTAGIFAAFSVCALVIYAKTPRGFVTGAASVTNIFFFLLFFGFALSQMKPIKQTSQ